jgi:hypothetical protein
MSPWDFQTFGLPDFPTNFAEYDELYSHFPIRHCSVPG